MTVMPDAARSWRSSPASAHRPGRSRPRLWRASCHRRGSTRAPDHGARL